MKKAGLIVTLLILLWLFGPIACEKDATPDKLPTWLTLEHRQKGGE